MAGYYKKRFYQVLEAVTFTVVCAIFIFAFYVFIRHVIWLRQDGYMRPLRFNYNQSFQGMPVNRIRGWMTFRYINLTYKLPGNYLQESLGITDKRYPNLTIDSLAKKTKISSAEFLPKVILAVQDYLNNKLSQ